MRIDEAHDYVQMRNGSSFVGQVVQKSFRVELGVSAEPLKVATSNLLHIVFSNKYGYAADELNFKDGSSLQGRILDTEVEFSSEALGRITIPAKGILAIQFLGNL